MIYIMLRCLRTLISTLAISLLLIADVSAKDYEILLNSAEQNISEFKLIDLQSEKILVAKNASQSISIWNYKLSSNSLKLIRRISFQEPISAFAVSSGSKNIAVSTGNNLQIIAANTGKTLNTSRNLTGQSQTVFLEYTSKGKKLVSLNHDGTVKFWNVRTLEVDSEYKTSPNGVVRSAFHEEFGLVILDKSANLTHLSLDSFQESSVFISGLDPRNASMIICCEKSDRLMILNTNSQNPEIEPELITAVWQNDMLVIQPTEFLELDKSFLKYDLEIQRLEHGFEGQFYSFVDGYNMAYHNKEESRIESVSDCSASQIITIKKDELVGVQSDGFMHKKKNEACTITNIATTAYIHDIVPTNNNKLLFFSSSFAALFNPENGIIERFESAQDIAGKLDEAGVGSDSEYYSFSPSFDMVDNLEMFVTVVSKLNENFVFYIKTDDLEPVKKIKIPEIPNDRYINDIRAHGNGYVVIKISSYIEGEDEELFYLLAPDSTLTEIKSDSSHLNMEYIFDYIIGEDAVYLLATEVGSYNALVFKSELSVPSLKFRPFAAVPIDAPKGFTGSFTNGIPDLVGVTALKELGITRWGRGRKYVTIPKHTIGNHDLIESINRHARMATILNSSGRNAVVNSTYYSWDFVSDEYKRQIGECSGLSSYIRLNNSNKVCKTSNSFQIWNSKYIEKATETAVLEDGSWVTLTKAGYFAGSVKVEGLLNLVSDFFVLDLDQLYTEFHRPDLVSKALKGSLGEIRTEKTQTNINKLKKTGLPPDVSIISPKNNQVIDNQYVDLILDIRKRNGGLGIINFNVNGSANKQKAKRQRDGTYKITGVPLSEKINVIEIVANTARKDGVPSEAQRVEVILSDRILKKTGSLHLVSIAVESYKDSFYDLDYSADDQLALTSLLKEYQPKSSELGYSNILIHTLTDKDVTWPKIRKKFTELKASVIKPNDSVIIHIAGHGVSIDSNYYFIPYDFTTKPGEKIKTAYSDRAIDQYKWTDLFTGIEASRTLLLFDTCDSGELSKLYTRNPGEDSQRLFASNIIRNTGRVLITASGSKNVALEGYEDHGLLTWAFLEALRDSDPENGISTNEIVEIIKDRVPEMFLTVTQGKSKFKDEPVQTPESVISGRHFRLFNTPVIYEKLKGFAPPPSGYYLTELELKVYDIPNRDGNVVEKLVPFHLIKIQKLDESNTWAKIRIDNRTLGYVEYSRLTRVYQTFH